MTFCCFSVEGNKTKLVYITGGHKPAIVDKIAEITGAEPVNGFETSVPEDEMMAIIIVQVQKFQIHSQVLPL